MCITACASASAHTLMYVVSSNDEHERVHLDQFRFMCVCELKSRHFSAIHFMHLNRMQRVFVHVCLACLCVQSTYNRCRFICSIFGVNGALYENRWKFSIQCYFRSAGEVNTNKYISHMIYSIRREW